MELHSLLTTLSNKGVKLSVNGSSLEIDAPKGVITLELRNSLAEYKTEILKLLNQDRVSVSSNLPTITPAPELRYEPFPLTDMQYAFWVGRSGVLELGNVANHGYYEIEGEDLNLERLNWALQQLIERHDMLRAVVLPNGQQQVKKTVPPYQMKVVDLRGKSEDVVCKKLEEIRDRLSHQVIPADQWPLFEFCATRLDDQRIRLHISYDLQVFDAWSLFRLFDEWFQLYQNPDVALPALELSFRDYVLAEQALQETQLYKRSALCSSASLSQEYWFSRLDSLPPAPDLPLAKNPKELKQPQNKRYESRMGRTDWQQLKQRAAQVGLTPSGLLLAAFAEIITLWSKNPQFTINLALFNRLPLHPQVNDILGDFTSVTLLAVDNSSCESFTERAVRLQKQLWQDLEHRYFSGVRVTRELARRRGTAPSAMPIVFTSTLGFSSLGQETLTFSHFGELVYGISQASQAWMDIQVWEEKGELTFNWDVVEELFPEGLIADMFEAYCRFLKQLATSEAGERLKGKGERLKGNGERLFSEAGERLKGEGERLKGKGERLKGKGERLSSEAGERLKGNGERLFSEAGERLSSEAGERLKGKGERLSSEEGERLKGNGERLSLRSSLDVSSSAWIETTRQLLPPAQLEQRETINATDAPIPDELLHQLFAAQVPGRAKENAVVTSQRRLTYQELSDRSNRVGHRLRKLGASPNHLVAVVMEKGWEQIVAVMGILASGAAYVPIDPKLPQERLLYLLENSEAEIVLTQSWLEEKLALPESIQCLCLDTDDLAQESKELLPPVQKPDDLAYVIYTSGSTGLPKGVMITHRNVTNVVIHTNQRFNVNSQDRILALTALNHDLSVYDIFGLLSAGGTIIMPDAVAVKDPSHWLELMVRERVTLWNSVPAMMEMLVDYAEEQSVALPNSWRLAILGGDWLPVSLPDRIRALVPNIQLLSIGGPTETTIWNVGYLIEKVDSNWKSIPYGQPMANSKYYILNDALEDCPVWVPGQMYCAGVQVAKGYWRNQEKTRASFITHPHTKERLYRTGDRGRYLPDGNIEFLGRVDFQIKIRGHRIEAGEIEAALSQHPSVRSAVVAAVGEQHHQERLVAYLVSEPKSALTIEEISHFLKEKLPEYMLPSAYVFLDALPLSANGKVDRNKLPTQDSFLQTREVGYVAPRSDIEKAIATAICEILQLEKVGVNDNFFDLGGNSLLLAKYYTKLQQLLPNELESISLIDLFRYSTIKALIDKISLDSKEFKSTDSSDKQRVELEQKSQQRKTRIQQRFQKSRLANL